MNNSITFETKCYEKDWKFLLKTNLLQHMIESCNHQFTEKRLYINNVSNLKEVKKYADQKISKSIIDAYYVVDEYADSALSFFQIDKNSFQGGYYYSISELVSIFLTDTDFIFHLSSDALPVKPQQDWINKGKILLQNNPEIIAANAIWDNKINEASNESTLEDLEWWLSTGFCDQNYLIKSSYFKRPIYSDKNELAVKYPNYGGESFEKRVFCHMASNSKLRATFKNAYYYHRTFPTSPLGKSLLFLKMKLLNKFR